MKKIIFILLILLIATPAAFSQDVFLPFLKVFSWISCDSLYTRAATISSSLTLSGSVSGGLTVDKIVVNDSLRVEETSLLKGVVTTNSNVYAGDDVGIGTTSPIARLMIADTTDGTPYFVLVATDSNRNVSTLAEAIDSAAVYAYIETDGDGYIGLKGNDGDFGSLQIDPNSFNIVSTNPIEIQPAGTARMTISSSQVWCINLKPYTDDTYSFGTSDYRHQNAYFSDNIYHGGKGQTATIYVSQENTIAGTDSSIKAWVDDGNGKLELKAGDADSLILYTDNSTAHIKSNNSISVDGAGGSINILSVDGNKTSGNLLQVTNNNDGTYVADDSSFAIEDDGRVSVCGILQQHVVVTDAAEYDVLAVNSGKVHLIADLTQNTTIDLPTEAAGLNYEFWYIGAAAEVHDHTIDSENNDNYFTGGIVHHDTDDGSVAAVFSNGSSNSILTLTNISGGTIIKVSCDGTDWSITGTVISDTAPAFSDQP